MKEWGNARGRMESEIQRKKEHMTVATNFEKSRGWVRKNWKTKNHAPNEENADNFLNLSLTSSEHESPRNSNRSPSIESPAKA